MNKEDLIKELRKPDQFKEIWLRKASGESICALINGNFGWLMYLHHANDIGYSSRNPEFESQEVIPFQLSNGQIDNYPRNWVYPVSVVRDALLHFLHHGQMYEGIAWHDDSFA